jgi:SPP1 gp7 family putative phage head morphogenesis protein
LSDPPHVVTLTQREDAIIDSVVQHVFARAVPGRSKLPFDRKSTRMMAETLLKAMEDGYGSALSDLTPGTPDYNMMQALGRNIYVFSAAKNWQMCREVTRNLVEDGQVVSFGKFRQKSAETLKQWVGPWLQAEYSHALAASQMASNWVALENSPATKLRYLTVNDRRVRPSHAKLHNICLPKDDAFWNTWYPPNGWLCRCNVISDSSGKLTDKSKIEYPDTKEAPEAFRFNPGKKKVIFPPDHPYYNATSKADLVKAIADMPREYQFDRIHSNENGGYLDKHILYKQGDDTYLPELAKWIAQKGKAVELLPEIHFSEKEVREKVFPGYKHPTKNPDMRIDGKYYDAKKADPTDVDEGIFDNIIRKANQKDVHGVVIMEHHNMPMDFLKRRSNARLAKPEITLQEILFYRDRKLLYKAKKE